MTHPDIPTAISISIVAATVLALIARQLRQPLILGYIAGGALLGPHVGFGLVQDQASIELISEMGLILLLFIIGLEISIPRVLQAGRTIAVTGLLQFPLCVALAWFVFDGVGTGRFDRLYLAVALSLSSTLIVVKLLFDKFEMATLAGWITVGILIFQDLWAIAFLAVQPTRRAPVRAAAALAARRARTRARGDRAVALRAADALPQHRALNGARAADVPGVVLRGRRRRRICRAFEGDGRTHRGHGHRRISVRYRGDRTPDRRARLLHHALLRRSRLEDARSERARGGMVTRGVRLHRREPVRRAAAALRRRAHRGGRRDQSRTDQRVLAGDHHARRRRASRRRRRGGDGALHAARDVGAVDVRDPVQPLDCQQPRARRRWVGLPQWARRGAPRATAADGSRRAEADVVFLGVSREGLAFVQHLERESPAMKARLVAIDFNPETLEQLQADGVECHYGDISNIETLRHAGVDRARIVVSSVSDSFLKGVDNRTLVRIVRGWAPHARIVTTADRLADAETLYAEGAAYVLIPPARRPSVSISCCAIRPTRRSTPRASRRPPSSSAAWPRDRRTRRARPRSAAPERLGR